MKVRHRALAALSGIAATAAFAAPALADGYSLAISGPSTGVVGQPVVLQVDGTNLPPSVDPYEKWLTAVLLLPQAATSCPSSDATMLALNTGGAVLDMVHREDVDSAGHFTLPIGFTPLVTGPLLVCGYTENETGYVEAYAGWTVTVQAAATTSPPASSPSPSPSPSSSPPGAAKPSSVAAPRVTRAGRRLVCSPGRWSNAPDRYAYAWRVDGRRRAVAHARMLRVTRGLGGHRVRCAVTATNAAGSVTAVSRGVRVR